VEFLNSFLSRRMFPAVCFSNLIFSVICVHKVKVKLSSILSITTQWHTEGGKISRWHQIEMSSQLHTLAALPP
jgi:hypothetical protein